MRKIRGLFQVRSMLFITGVDVSVSQTERGPSGSRAKEGDGANGP